MAFKKVLNAKGAYISATNTSPCQVQFVLILDKCKKGHFTQRK